MAGRGGEPEFLLSTRGVFAVVPWLALLLLLQRGRGARIRSQERRRAPLVVVGQALPDLRHLHQHRAPVAERKGRAHFQTFGREAPIARAWRFVVCHGGPSRAPTGVNLVPLLFVPASAIAHWTKSGSFRGDPRGGRVLLPRVPALISKPVLSQGGHSGAHAEAHRRSLGPGVKGGGGVRGVKNPRRVLLFPAGFLAQTRTHHHDIPPSRGDL